MAYDVKYIVHVALQKQGEEDGEGTGGSTLYIAESSARLEVPASVAALQGSLHSSLSEIFILCRYPL